MTTCLIAATPKFMVDNCSNKKAAENIEWPIPTINLFQTHQFMADHSKAHLGEDYFHCEI